MRRVAGRRLGDGREARDDFVVTTSAPHGHRGISHVPAGGGRPAGSGPASSACAPGGDCQPHGYDAGVSELDRLREEACACTRCALAPTRTQVVFGVGNPDAALLFVGEGPGREEDLAGEPFVGRSGRLLDQLMDQELGWDRQACYIANVVKCRPPGNRDPQPAEMEACRPYLDRQISIIAPHVVVSLGNVATRALLGIAEGIRNVRGKAYPFPASFPLADGWIVPTYHPAFALRAGGDAVAEMRADLIRAKRLLATTAV